jgi:hypothetical protein
VALVGETLDQAREVMVFGESGILACAPPDRWSYFVLLDGTLEQIELAASGRNTLQYFQIGPAARPYSDYSYRKLSAAFAGNGLRPYAPAHLAQKWDGADLEFSWIRRARLDGASWDLAEIPLSETQERYQVKIFSGAQLLRLEEVIKRNGAIAPRCRRLMGRRVCLSCKWRSSLKVLVLACAASFVSRFDASRRLR